MADVTFDLYKLLVEEAREARRARRELSNTFMTLNLAGVGALGFLARNQLPGADKNLTMFGLCAFALVLTCIIWGTSNSYYTNVLTAKYNAINALEDKLGARPFQDEWAALSKRGRALRWFTLERAMPMLFIIGYAIFFSVQSGFFQPGMAYLQALIASWLPHAH